MDLIPIIKPWVDQEEIRAVSEVIESGWLAQGPRVEEFETALATHVRAQTGVAVSSCTAGLHLALHALGIGPGNEVVVPSLSFIATANVPRYCGATTVFADVDPTTFNLTAETIEAVITPSTRAIILVHQLGMPADIDSVSRLCEERDLLLIEDAACAIGSTYKGAPIGSHSELVAFSFHPRKLLTTGEGGMVMTSDPHLAERLRRLRQHAMSLSGFDRHLESQRPTFDEIGFNYRMTDLQAAIGLTQLKRLDELVAVRREKAERYRELLGDIERVTTPSDPPYGKTNYQSYSVMIDEISGEKRDDISHELLGKGVSTRQGVMAAHVEAAHSRRRPTHLPNTEVVAAQSLLLPLFHDMTLAQQEYVARTLDTTLDRISSS